MRYILQIFTGGWDKPNYTSEEILDRLKNLIPRMKVDKVILGWYPDRSLYRPIGEYLKEQGIDMLLWLPVFAELGDRVPMKEAVDLWGRSLTQEIEQEGETFAFSCPTDPHNLRSVVDVYDTEFTDVGFSGVFLDRVRTHSFVGGVPGVLSCGCENCRKVYSEHGVSLTEIAEAYEKLPAEVLDVIRKAAENIRIYHEKQKQYSWFDSTPSGTILGQKVTPIGAVGVYVPGGKAAYPSSVLMNVIPAKVAGVERIAMVTPPELYLY